MPLQEVIAFRDAEIDELTIVAADLALQGGKGSARIRIAARPVQLDRPPEIELVTLPNGDVAQRLELGGGSDRRVGERKLVVDPQQALCGLAAIAEDSRLLALPGENLFVDRGLVRCQLLVNGERVGVIAQCGGCLSFAKRRRDRQIPCGRALLQRIEGGARVRRAVESKLSEALVVRGVVGKRAAGKGRSARKRQRVVVSTRGELCGGICERLIQRRGARGRGSLRRHQPHVTRGRWQRRMRRCYKLTGTWSARAHERHEDHQEAAGQDRRQPSRRRASVTCAHSAPPRSAESPSARVCTSSC